MKKLLLPICIIALVALLLSAVNGKSQKSGNAAPKVTSVSEAAFSMRSSGSTDISSRLVGNFVSEHGEKLCFDGSGEVRRVAQNLSTASGSYTLLQSQDGSAILDLQIDGNKWLYSLALASPDGSFTLTDENGQELTINPIPY